MALLPIEWDDHYPVTAPVTALPGGDSPYGMRHMLGNVAEWCSDWYARDAYRAPAGRDPQGPQSGTERVLRGAGWGTQLFDLRVTLRHQRQAPELRNEYMGFRCVRPAR